MEPAREAMFWRCILTEDTETAEVAMGINRPMSPPFENTLGVRPVDVGIRHAVEVLSGAGVHTFESCEGGPGHSFPEPTVRFHGDSAEGFRALGIALQNGLNVAELRRYYSIVRGEPHGPEWEMTFAP